MSSASQMGSQASVRRRAELLGVLIAGQGYRSTGELDAAPVVSAGGSEEAASRTAPLVALTPSARRLGEAERGEQFPAAPVVSAGRSEQVVRRTAPLVATLVCLLISAGCRQQMADQPSYRPLAASDFFEDGRASRPVVEGTVARGLLKDDEALYTGKSGAEFVTAFPYQITRTVLARGHERYDIFCAPCHDRLGNGLGMVVRRGYPQPPSFHIDRLREAKPGYLFDVITRGFGRMPDYAAQIPPRDRWAIVAYLRALQLSQRASATDVPPPDRVRLEAEPEGAR